MDGLSLWYIKYVYIRWRDQAMVWTAPDSISSSPWPVTEVWLMQYRDSAWMMGNKAITSVTKLRLIRMYFWSWVLRK